MALTDPRHQELIDILEDSLANLQRHSVRVVATLAEIEVKEVYLELGYSSMWAFCMKRYNMTRDETSLRLGVARLVQNHPQLLGALERCEVTLTNLQLLRNMIDDANVDALVALSTRKSKEEVKDILAEIDPKAADGGAGKRRDETSEPPLRKQKRPDVESVAAGIFMLTLTFDRVFRDEIAETRELTRHMIPSGDLLEITRAAYRALREQAKKTKPAANDTPAAKPAANDEPAAKPAANDEPTAKPRRSKDPTYISMETRRAVYARDGGRCTFIGAEGHRCEARKALQFDHIELRSRGGVGTIENVRLRCRAHNLYTAKKTLGEKFVADKIAAARKERDAKKEQTAKTQVDVAAAGIETSEPQKPAGASTPAEQQRQAKADRNGKRNGNGSGSGAEAAAEAQAKTGSLDDASQGPALATPRRRGPEVSKARKPKPKSQPQPKHSVQTESKRASGRVRGRRA